MPNTVNLNRRTLPVSLYRGDSANLICQIDLSNNPIAPTHFELQGSDKLYLGIIEPEKIFEDAIVKKIASSESPKTEEKDPIIKLESLDTEYLMPGTYYIQGKLLQTNELTGEETITTVIPTTILYIL